MATTGTQSTIARAVHELGLDGQNKAVIGRLLAHGGLAHAQEDDHGRMHAQIRIFQDELVWDPTVLVMPHAGDLELEVLNDDHATNCAHLPSNGQDQFIGLVNQSRGTASLNLDGPGYYWFGSTMANNEGRGLVGAIVVLGDVPPKARLDRPAQPRP